MTPDFQQGYDDHALALGKDPQKASGADYQAGWKQSKTDTRNIINHGKAIQQTNAGTWHPSIGTKAQSSRA